MQQFGAMRGWSRQFDDPIPLPGGGKLVTLRVQAAIVPNRSPSMVTGAASAQMLPSLWVVAVGDRRLPPSWRRSRPSASGAAPADCASFFGLLTVSDAANRA
jgi:hypothetical protein